MSNDDFSAPAVSAFGFVTSSTSSSIAGPAFDSILALNVIVDCITFILIDFTKSNYFYKKKIIAEDLTNSKLYMKKMI